MIPSELLKKIRRIQIRTAHVVSDLLAGQYHSAFKGRGMEFEEVRPYQIGDDVRSIDWNVSARFGEPFVKTYREERELTVLLMVDMSASHAFGSVGQLKRDLAAEVCATLAFSAIQNNDKVGLLCFTDRIEKRVAPDKGTQHVLRVIREVLYHQPQGRGTSLRAAFEYINHQNLRRAVIFVISDFLDEGFEQPLRIARRRHDVIAIPIGDPREAELPNVGLLEARDLESGATCVIDTGSRRVRAAFAADAARRRQERDRLLRRINMDAIEVRTGESFFEPLTRFFQTRGKRR